MNKAPEHDADHIDNPHWEAVIGLEAHAQLDTQSKLFSPAPSRFGDEPNTNVDPISLGLPGTLPKLNKDAVRRAVALGCALGAQIAPYSRFDRKSYFYPDSPRNYQITQFYKPILWGGSITDEESGRCFALDRAHLEDDAGMLKHFHEFAGVDYNRAGMPLIEIVSKPCIHTPQQARRYLLTLKQILQYMGVCQANMERGELRIDANISVRRQGEQELRPKAEIKNMNSVSNLEAALEQEIKRQIALYEAHPDQEPTELMGQTTYRWDPDRRDTVKMRAKESAADYRYFPDPDLPPIVLDQAFITKIEQSLPELPRLKKARFQKTLSLTSYQIETLMDERAICLFFEEALKETSSPTKMASSLCNWITVELMGRLHEKGLRLSESKIKPEHMAQLVNMLEHGQITGKIAKKVADDMVAHPGTSPNKIVAENSDYRPINDPSQIEAWVDEVLREQAQAAQDFLHGKGKAYGFLVGQVMALSRGKADPELVNRLLKEKLKNLPQ